MGLHYTEHVNKRMKERGITSDMINLTLKYGKIDQDAYELNNKLINESIKSLEYEKKHIERTLKIMRKMKDKGGVRVIIVGENLITAYDSNSRRNAY